MKVTGLKEHIRKKGFFRIYIDNRFYFLLPAGLIKKKKLFEGKDIDPSLIEELSNENRFYRALEYARLLLSYRRRSRFELACRLKVKDYDEETVQKVLRRLEETGEIDDFLFARSWIVSRRQGRPLGDFAIREELKEKGVEENIVQEAFESLGSQSQTDKIQLASRAIGSKLKTYRGLDKNTARRRIRGLLARRGFDFDTIKKVEKDFFSNIFGKED